MKKNQPKTTSILLRVTAEEKATLKEKAAQSGLSMTDYLLKKSEDHVIVSPLLAREVLQVIHSLHLQLQQLQNKQIDIKEFQDTISDYALFLREHMSALKLSLGGSAKCLF
jgi:uncharacterized protein (DUF1778 family)